MRAPIPKEPSPLALAIRANRERCIRESYAKPALTIADSLTMEEMGRLIEEEIEAEEIERQMG